MKLVSKLLHVATHLAKSPSYQIALKDWIIWKVGRIREPTIVLEGKNKRKAQIGSWHNLSELFFWRNYEIPKAESAVIAAALAKTEAICLDVGANIGIYSLYFAAHGASRVFAFEASTPNYTRLERNRHLNPDLASQIFPIKAAVSDKPGYVSIQFNNESPGQTSISVDCAKSETSPTIILDQFCKEQSLDCIDLLKIDVEGHEMQVMRGCQNLLEQKRIGLILFESIEEGLKSHGSSRAVQWEFLRALGYQVTNLSRECLSLPEYLDSDERDFLAYPLEPAPK